MAIDAEMFGDLLGEIFLAHCELVSAEMQILESPDEPVFVESMELAETRIIELEEALHAAIRDSLVDEG